MQPKLQGDTFYLATADGIYLRNNRQDLRLRGEDIYQWITALEPYLDGQCTLEMIVDGLEPEQQSMVQDIVETLLTHGFLKDCSHDLPHTLDEGECITYAPEIAFIDSFRDSARAVFEHFRAQRVLIIGSGLTALALVQATLQAGTLQTTIWVTDECKAYNPRLQAYCQQAQERDPGQMVFIEKCSDWWNEDALREILQDFDVVFHLSDRPMLERVLTLNSLCFALQKPLFQALILNDQALLGPVVAGDAGCWECTWRRWLANQDTRPETILDPWQNDLTAPVSPLLGLPTAALVANILSFECFKYLTEAGSCQIHGKMLQLDLETLRCQSHAFLPHPLCRTCQRPSPLTEEAFLEKMGSLEAKEAIAEETFSQQAVTLFDPSLGIFSYLGEEDLVQMPLNVSRLTLSAPMSPEQSQQAFSLTRADLGLDETRQMLTLQGCAHYAARLIDQRRFVSQTNELRAWTYDLHTREARLIPAAQIFPAGNQQDAASYLGVSAGLSWAEACARALLAHALHLTLQDVLLGETRYEEIALHMQILDFQGKHLFNLIKQAGVSLHIYSVHNAFQVPTLAFCCENKTLVYHTHFDAAQALNGGLIRVVQYLQARQEGQPLYALPAVPQLSLSAGAEFGPLPTGPAVNGWQEGLDWLLKTLQCQHWHALAFPLDHDPALCAILPFLVRVLLVREEA